MKDESKSLRLKKQLENNSYFSIKENNIFGSHYYIFLNSRSYLELSNPEPLNPEKNTLQKIFSALKVIETYFNKPFDKIKFAEFDKFLADFQNEKIIAPTGKPYSIQNIKRYVGEYKRLIKVVKAYKLTMMKRVNQKDFNWVESLKPPRVKKKYLNYPYLSWKEVKKIALGFSNKEYYLRTMLSVNLMARPCEIENLMLDDFEFRGAELWVKLPDIKRNSANKVPVQIISDYRKEITAFINYKKEMGESKLFSHKEPAYAKALRNHTEKKIHPKTLRKIGVGVFEQFEYSRSDVERIGGWEANSDVLNHYFNRRGVDSKKADVGAQRAEIEDYGAEFETLKKQTAKQNKLIRILLKSAMTGKGQLNLDDVKSNPELLDLMVKQT